MKKWLICIMSLLLMLGLSIPVSAAVWETDATGDTAGAGVSQFDIESAMLELYPQNTELTYPDGLEEYGTLCIKMAEGSNMPGLIMLGLDSDSDTSTGANYMSTLMKTCASGAATKIKTTQKGIDVSIFFYLRDQDDSAASAYGYDCMGPPVGGSCMTQGDQCTTCTDPDNCWKGASQCGPDDAACYVRGDICKDSGGEDCVEDEDNCSMMNQVCERNTPCNVGKLRGEWIANPFGGGGGQNTRPVNRGRIDMPLPPGPTDPENSFCFKFPFKRIIQGADLASTDAPKADYTKAIDPTMVKWEVSTWYRYPETESDDIITPSPPAPDTCVNVTDVLPNTNTLPAAQGTTGAPCEKYQRLYQWCFNKVANVNLDFDECKDACKAHDEADCNTNSCEWCPDHDGNQIACEATASCEWDADNNLCIGPSGGCAANQTGCEAINCFWYAGKSRCVIDVCQTDVTFDSKVTGSDLGVLKKEYGRMGCP